MGPGLALGGRSAHCWLQRILCGFLLLTPVPPPPKAIMQATARKNEWPLDKMCLTVDITKKTKEDYGHPPREGAYLHGLLMEGKMPLGAYAGLSHLEPFALGFKLVFVLCLLSLAGYSPGGHSQTQLSNSHTTLLHFSLTIVLIYLTSDFQIIKTVRCVSSGSQI